MHDVILLPIADEDIFRNASWWAEHHSLQQALSWESSVRSQLGDIAFQPESRPFSTENPMFAYDIRDALVGSSRRRTYRAVFTIHRHKIYILRVLRGAQDTITPNDVPFNPAEH